MRLWCNGKRWGLSFCFGGFLYLYLMYRSPCRQFSEMKEKRIRMECREGWNPPLYGVYAVICFWVYHVSVHGYPTVTAFCCLFRVVLWSVRGCESVSAILLCYIAFGLVPVGRHRWARLFWLVAGTNARRCSFRCVYASWMGRFWSLFLVLFCFYVFFLIRESSLFLSQQTQQLKVKAKPCPSGLNFGLCI